MSDWAAVVMLVVFCAFMVVLVWLGTRRERSDVAPLGALASDSGNAALRGEGPRPTQAGGEPVPDNPPTYEWDDTPLPPIEDAVFSLEGWLIDTGPHPEYVHKWFTTIGDAALAFGRADYPELRGRL